MAGHHEDVYGSIPHRLKTCLLSLSALSYLFYKILIIFSKNFMKICQYPELCFMPFSFHLPHISKKLTNSKPFPTLIIVISNNLFSTFFKIDQCKFHCYHHIYNGITLVPITHILQIFHTIEVQTLLTFSSSLITPI